MGAEIVWFPPAPTGPLRVGAIRYGEQFESAGARHRYDGNGVTADWGDGRAVISPLGSDAQRPGRLAGWLWRLLRWLLGRPPEFSRRNWEDILAAHAREGFARVEFERHGSWYVVDVTGEPPFKMRPIGRVVG